ncbi:MAG: FG-GAP-like repeat-containing protein, partial [bacterium]
YSDSLTVRDVDGDGKADLLWVDLDDQGKPTGALQVLLNTSSLSTLSFNLGSDSHSGELDFLDIDGDGKIDWARTLRDAEGNVIGLTASFLDYSVTKSINGALKQGLWQVGEQAYADINGDGVDDAVFRGADNRVRVALGSLDKQTGDRKYGAWSFLPAAPGGVGFADSLQLGDIDGDGRVDMVWTKVNGDGLATGEAYIMRNTSTRDQVSFAAAVSSETTAGEARLVDVDGDGRDDLVRVVTSPQGFVTALQVRFGQVGGGLSETALVGQAKNGLVRAGEQFYADVNGDDVQDSVFRGADNSLRVALGEKDCNDQIKYGAWTPLAAPAGYDFKTSNLLVVGDVYGQGDGKAELVWVKTDANGLPSGEVTLWRNTSSGSVVSFISAGTNNDSGDASLVDVDGDGRGDLVRTVYDAQNNLVSKRVYFGQSNGSFAGAALMGLRKDGVLKLGETVHADVNGDDVVDAIFRGADNSLRVAFGSEDARTKAVSFGDWQSATAAPGFGFNDSLQVADVTGDGKADFLWVSVDGTNRPTGSATLQVSDSSATVLSLTLKGAYGGAGKASLADVDGDGRADLVRTELSANGDILGRSVYFAQANGSFAVTPLVATVNKTGQFVLGEQFDGDFNGDGIQDKLWRDNANVVRVALGTKIAGSPDKLDQISYGDWSVAAIGAPAGITFADALQVADVNGDGKADLIWVKRAVDDLLAGQVYVQRNTSALAQPGWTASFSNSNTLGTGAGMSDATAGLVGLQDVDGDGRMDLIRQGGQKSQVRLGQADGGWGVLQDLKYQKLNAPYAQALFVTAAGVANTKFFIQGSDRDQTLIGSAWSDTLVGGVGNDVLQGGQGNDVYLFRRGQGQDRIEDAGGADDRIELGSGIALTDIYLSRDASDLTLSIPRFKGKAPFQKDDRIVVVGYYSQPQGRIERIDFADGSYFDDESISKWFLQATENADYYWGDASANTYKGYGGDDAIYGLGGADVLSGGAGNDTLDGGSAADTLIGGGGDDLFIVDNAGDIVVEYANEGVDTVQTSVSYTLSAHVESLTLTGAGTIIGVGNGGDNVLTASAAGQELRGGAGYDTYVVNVCGVNITENAGEGVDTVQTSVSYTLSANVENLTLTGTNAIVGVGNGGANVLTASAASQELRGGAGNDTYYIAGSAGVVIVENAGEGVDTVLADVDYTLGANLENLTLLG